MFFISDEKELVFDKIKALYFYASWMPYHKKMTIMIDKVEKKHDNINFFAIDVDHFKVLCKRFEVTSIPTVIIMIDSREIKRLNGLILTSAFKSAFADI